jgi:hypothetical protein
MQSLEGQMRYGTTAGFTRRGFKVPGLGLVTCTMAALMGAVPGYSQETAKVALPDTTKCPDVIAEVATCYTAKHASGAFLLAALPKNWNGNLVVFAHGGPDVAPPTAIRSQADLTKYSYAVKLGYAWVASTYRREGYGVGMAAEDSDNARRFFIERIGKPKRTILHGASYGGLVGAKTIETYAKGADGAANYDAGFFNSGIVAGVPQVHDFRADLRVVYQYYCKNLPRPDEAQYPLWTGISADAKMTLADMTKLIDECTGITKPANARTDTQKQNLANILGVMRFPESMLVRHMQASTLLFRDIAQRMTNGRSAFSNMNVAYKGSSNDADLNRNVVRFDADPQALAILKAEGTPTGQLPVPVLSIHSINDPQVAVEVQTPYREMVHAAGRGDRLVQAYTDENAHTGQSSAELAASLDSLMQWVEKGVKPTPQSIATRCEQLVKEFEGPCRYRPQYESKAYATRYARGAEGL